ncbi:MAG TPA: hypothetical protein VLM42_11135 [Bryobacteraceae bacterium]|nr:hypothetical protein [Bryobacteraceae bacterium]
MVFGMSLATYTAAHVAISLIGIGSGLVVLFGLLKGKNFCGWTALFLATTVATSVTGFGFPVAHFLPSHGVGILSLIALAVAIAALYKFHLAGGWRRTYVICSVVALYFNCFVLVVQSFEKLPALKALAPTQTEPPFALAQLVVLGLFVHAGIQAAQRFRLVPPKAYSAYSGR